MRVDMITIIKKKNWLKIQYSNQESDLKMKTKQKYRLLKVSPSHLQDSYFDLCVFFIIQLYKLQYWTPLEDMHEPKHFYNPSKAGLRLVLLKNKGSSCRLVTIVILK